LSIIRTTSPFDVNEYGRRGIFPKIRIRQRNNLCGSEFQEFLLMFSSRSLGRGLVAFSVLCGAAHPAAADPPGRVARVSYLTGSVSFRPSTVDEWMVASVNYPLTIGDHLWTDRGSKAELDLGSIFVRLAPGTEFSIVNLDDRLAQLRMTQGAATVRVARLDSEEAIEVDTPIGAVSLFQPGFYRIDVDESGETARVTVRSGEAELTAGGGATPVHAQQSVFLNGIDTQPSAAAAMPTDDFEDWCLARDRRVDTSLATPYVSPDTPGYADLDQYGGWQQIPEYGPVWIPRVSAAWVPYRYGRWVWIDPWGWTWIDDAPWGFAPFHYGRWVHLSPGWAWAPGRVVARPVYAPALVAFVAGSGWQASIGIGSEPVAWFPLAPHEPFIPAYRVSQTYVQRVNITQVNVTNIDVTRITYANRNVAGAVTAVPRDAFVHARPVAAAAAAVPRDAIRTAPVAAAAPAAPQQASRLPNGAARAAVPPAAAVNRAVVVQRVPPESARTPVRDAGGHVPAPAVPPPTNNPPRAQDRPQPPPTPQPTPQIQPRREAPSPSQPAPNPNLAARHAQERADLDARQAGERAQLQTRHQAEERAVQGSRERQQLRTQHEQEQKAMQERHKQERDAVQKRQEQERRKKGGG
jgi:hypothetical protein